MTPVLDESLLAFLDQPARDLSLSVGLVILALTLAALTCKVLLQAAAGQPLHPAARVFNVLAAPGLLVVVLIVIERFRVLS